MGLLLDSSQVAPCTTWVYDFGGMVPADALGEEFEQGVRVRTLLEHDGHGLLQRSPELATAKGGSAEFMDDEVLQGGGEDASSPSETIREQVG